VLFLDLFFLLLDARSLSWAYEMQQCDTTPPKTNMTMEKQPFEDVFPVLKM